MAYQVAIIGSFQKYYSQVVELIRMFKGKGLYVQSPKDSVICDRVEDFVIFQSDNSTYTPDEIQMITLEKILNADAVYVYNPDGYVGKTTCYEIGFCLSRYKPIYFLCRPTDLPIPVQKDQIISPEKFAELVLNNFQKLDLQYKMCALAQKAIDNIFGLSVENKSSGIPKLVICGSMQFYDEMLECQNRLKQYGITCVVPKDENDIVDLCTEDQFREFKRKVSSAYLKKIRERDTIAVLIYNATKKGQNNYIGANTLVELAMAFTWNRKIFLYNDIYKPLEDELLAWGCVSLNGDLGKLVKELEMNQKIEKSPSADSYQLSIFDNYVENRSENT